MNILDFVMDLIYPRDLTCVLCSEESDDELCDLCKGSIQFNIGRVCKACGRMITTDYGICRNCMSMERMFDYGVSVVTYDDYIKGLMYKLKYHNKRYIAHTMAKYILDYILQLNLKEDFDGIIPVPLHENRLKNRGYNQAYLIAMFLSEMTGLKVYETIRRVVNTRPLNKMTREERSHILEDAFEVTRCMEGNYILIDDIFTTGTTVNTCSKLLKASGVSQILVATFAVGE